MAKYKADVVLARKLLVAVWHVLTDRELAHDVDEHQVASWLMSWAWKLTEAHRHGMGMPEMHIYKR